MAVLLSNAPKRIIEPYIQSLKEKKGEEKGTSLTFAARNYFDACTKLHAYSADLEEKGYKGYDGLERKNGGKLQKIQKIRVTVDKYEQEMKALLALAYPAEHVNIIMETFSDAVTAQIARDTKRQNR